MDLNLSQAVVVKFWLEKKENNQNLICRDPLLQRVAHLQLEFSLNQPHRADSVIESPCPWLWLWLWLCTIESQGSKGGPRGAKQSHIFFEASHWPSGTHGQNRVLYISAGNELK